METIGEHLKRVRKTCGYSLDDVAHVTRINLRYLESIENDEFSRLPGETFLQGFLRSYARFLGIDEQEIIRKFKERKGLDAPTVDTRRIDEDRGERPSITPKNIKVILPLTGGVILLLLIIIFFGGGRETSSIQNSKEMEEVRVEPAEVKPGQVVQPAAVPVSLKLKAKELTWIRTNIDEKEMKEILLRPGEEVSWKGEKKVTMTLGNAGGVEVEIEGKKQEPFGKSGAVVRNIVITSAGVTKGVADSGKQPHLRGVAPGKKLEVKAQKPKEASPLMNLPP